MKLAVQSAVPRNLEASCHASRNLLNGQRYVRVDAVPSTQRTYNRGCFADALRRLQDDKKSLGSKGILEDTSPCHSTILTCEKFTGVTRSPNSRRNLNKIADSQENEVHRGICFYDSAILTRRRCVCDD